MNQLIFRPLLAVRDCTMHYKEGGKCIRCCIQVAD